MLLIMITIVIWAWAKSFDTNEQAAPPSAVQYAYSYLGARSIIWNMFRLLDFYLGQFRHP